MFCGTCMYIFHSLAFICDCLLQNECLQQYLAAIEINIHLIEWLISRYANFTVREVKSSSKGLQLKLTSTVGRCPFSDAYIRGVHCSLVSASTGAPQASSTFSNKWNKLYQRIACNLWKGTWEPQRASVSCENGLEIFWNKPHVDYFQVATICSIHQRCILIHLLRTSCSSSSKKFLVNPQKLYYSCTQFLAEFRV